MQSDLSGRVRNTYLPRKSALLPVYEAVINAVHAIKDRNATDGLIQIEIERSASLFSGEAEDTNTLPPINGFSITDNGVGFVDRNYESFDTLDSGLKAGIGGKGVGRLTWLVAFDHATVTSVYPEKDAWWERTFEFRRTARGIDLAACTRIEGERQNPTTKVRLVGFRDEYRQEAPKTARLIARRIVEHCLALYLLDQMSRIVLSDQASPGEQHDLTDLFRSEVRQSGTSRKFLAGDEQFQIDDVLIHASGDVENVLLYCGNQRVVKSQRLGNMLPHAGTPFHLNGEEVVYTACVTGAFLDRRVDAQRTDFAIDHEGDLGLTRSGLTWEKINRAAASAAAEFLEPFMAEARQQALERIRLFVETKEPRYRILVDQRSTALAAIPSNLTDDKLELELHKELSDWRLQAKKEARSRLEATPSDPESFSAFRKDFVKALGTLEEVQKADLVDYVIHRRTVLDFYAKVLGLQESGKFAEEAVLHGLVFPMKTTSNGVDYDNHNLWLLDERLAFHQFLASDLQFSAQVASPVQIDSDDRPDLVIYNHPIALVEGHEEISSVILVEFKRPERDDYTAKDNPIDQIADYVELILLGKAKRPDGSRIQPPRENTPFYCYVVATITQKLRTLAAKRGFRPLPDGQGFFYFNENYKAYTEIIDYRKVLADATKRNKVFFERLGLHTGMRRQECRGEQ